MYVELKTLITAASVLTATLTIGGAFVGVLRWVDRQNRQDKEIQKIKEEQCLLTYGVLACLKGLREQGCNGPVNEAIQKIEKHLNVTAHEQEV